MGSLQVLFRPSVRALRTAAAASRSLTHHHQHYRYGSSAQFPSSQITPSFPALLFPTEEKGEDGMDIGNRNAVTKLVNLGFFNPLNKQIVNKTPADEEISNSHCVGSTRGWLAFISRIDCRFYLSNVLSPSPTIVPLPSIETLPSYARGGREDWEKICYRHSNRLTGEVIGLCCPHLMSELAVSKVIITSDPTANDCIVMIRHGIEFEDLAFCRIGDTRWTVLESLPGRDEFAEFVYSKMDRLFYALTYDSGRIEAFDLLSNPSSPRRFDCPAECDRDASSEFETEIYGMSFYHKIYLVESPRGDLLKVFRYYSSIGEDGYLTDGEGDKHYKHPYRSVYFQVYKLDSRKQNGEKVEDLDDTVLFLGHNESFSLSVDDHQGLKPNSIYFADDLMDMIYDGEHDYPFGGHDNGVYNLKDRSVSPLYEPFEYKKILPPPFWVSSA